MDLTELLGTFDDGSGPGEDMEYEPAFTALELAAKPGEERVMGDEVLEAEEPNWREVRDKALEVLTESKDLRAAIHLARASLALGGFPDFAISVAYLRRCLTEQWDGCHPMLDADDDNDPTMRVNAVLGLTDASGILKAVRMAPLTQSRAFGQLSLFHVEIAEGEVEAPESLENVPDAVTLSAAYQDTDPEFLTATLTAASAIIDDLDAINTKFDEEIGTQGPNLDPLTKAMRRIQKALTEATGGAGGEDTGDEDAQAEIGADGAPVAAAPRRGVGEVHTRKDVVQAIDKIIGYYKANEPSSPVPIILMRARRLVDADFMAIMENMAPDAIHAVRQVTGPEEPEEDGY
ncbi:MAG: type VI secretion system protein TssA [Pseudomonadota bacterium]